MADLHYNSNIKISMDEKARHKSQYMKKYAEEHQKRNSLHTLESRPAGTINLLRTGAGVGDDPHLNASRRRILNDFITQRPRGSLEIIANRNANDLLKIPVN